MSQSRCFPDCLHSRLARSWKRCCKGSLRRIQRFRWFRRSLWCSPSSQLPIHNPPSLSWYMLVMLPFRMGWVSLFLSSCRRYAPSVVVPIHICPLSRCIQQISRLFREAGNRGQSSWSARYSGRFILFSDEKGPLVASMLCTLLLQQGGESLGGKIEPGYPQGPEQVQDFPLRLPAAAMVLSRQLWVGSFFRSL